MVAEAVGCVGRCERHGLRDGMITWLRFFVWHTTRCTVDRHLVDPGYNANATPPCAGEHDGEGGVLFGVKHPVWHLRSRSHVAVLFLCWCESTSQGFFSPACRFFFPLTCVWHFALESQCMTL